MAGPDYTLRRATPEDEDFLYALFSVSRPDVSIIATWPETEREAFLRNQFHLQHHHYETSFPDSAHDIILVDDEPVGRVWMDWRDDEVRGLDIAILPDHRRKGLGGRIMEDLKAEADRRQIPFTLCVEHNNPDAKRFYEAHDCVDYKDIGTHMMMEWDPRETAKSED